MRISFAVGSPLSPINGNAPEYIMAHPTTRRELYDLVWSVPMRLLAQRYDISDVGLAKICKRMDIPVPSRGYWAKQQAGIKVSKLPLPPRAIGMSEEGAFGGNSWGYYSDEEAAAMKVPPPPVFEDDMTAVAQRVKKMVAKAKIPKTLKHPHRLLERLLQKDNERREKQLSSGYSWDAPIFDSPFEQRRLKILNSLFTGAEQCGMKPSLRGREARELYLAVGHQNVSFTLDSTAADRDRHGYMMQPRGPHDKMRMRILTCVGSTESYMSWEDKDGAKVEDYLVEILEELIISGERQHRSQAERHCKWVAERKENAIESLRVKKLEDERRERERQQKLEKQRVDYLLNQADAFRKANEIRAYVESVRQTNSSAPDPMPQQELHEWADWALAQADRIDPVQSGKYRVRMKELQQNEQ